VCFSRSPSWFPTFRDSFRLILIQHSLQQLNADTLDWLDAEALLLIYDGRHLQGALKWLMITTHEFPSSTFVFSTNDGVPIKKCGFILRGTLYDAITCFAIVLWCASLVCSCDFLRFLYSE
jgi:hypothetical protein